jgi:hypothetical protein
MQLSGVLPQELHLMQEVDWMAGWRQKLVER